MTTETKRLFWACPSLLEFDAEVLGAEARGERFAVVLDRTAFFPAAGGQPSDRGAIGAGRVVDVLEEGDAIVHLVEGLPAAPAGPVHAAVDPVRRADLACQHTAQHLVSALAAARGARTVGFHLGELVTTVDLEGGDLDAPKIRELERAANAAVREDREVTIGFASGRARRVGLELVRAEGELRIVSIAGLGESACCGSHVERTGRLGAIRLGRIERVRAALRVELFAGDRVLAEAERLAGILAALSEKTGAGVDDLPTWADATLAELRARKRECADLAERAAGFEAAALAARAEAIGGRRLVACAPSERDAKALKLLATAIRRAPGTIAIVGAAQAGKAALVVARAADLDLDVRPILKRAAEELGARGGGTADLAQCGGGDPTRLEAAIAFAAALARSALAEVGP